MATDVGSRSRHEFPVAALGDWLARVGPADDSEESASLTTEGRAALLGLYTSADPVVGPAGGALAAVAGHGRVGVEVHWSSPSETLTVLADALHLGASTAWICADRRVDSTVRLANYEPQLRSLLSDSSAACLVNVGVSASRMSAGSVGARLSESERGLAIVADPLATLARDGALPIELTQALGDLAACTGRAVQRDDERPTVLVSTSPVHEAGGDAVDELAVALATAVHYLRVIEATGVPVEQAARRFVFRFETGAHLVDEIAKLRAARVVWAHLLSSCGVDSESLPMCLHAFTSTRGFSTLDPWHNVLRATLAASAARIGCADVVYHAPMNALDHSSHPFARRLALNGDAILRLEAGLDAVADPSAGSYAIESKTEVFARAAWDAFSELERAGGIVASLCDGSLARRFARRSRAEAEAVASGTVTMVGVNRYTRRSWPPMPAATGVAASYGDGPEASTTTVGSREPPPEAVVTVSPLVATRPARVCENGEGGEA